jgi:hypothetical protein
VQTPTDDFLSQQRQEILRAAAAALARAQPSHYQSAGPDEVRRRLEALFDRLVETATSHNLQPMISYAQDVAQKRFTAGYDLFEVQTAFNALEEAAWARILSELEPSEYAEKLGLVTTILGTGKDALARTYVSLAAQAHVPSLDMRALFAGTESPSH